MKSREEFRLLIRKDIAYLSEILEQLERGDFDHTHVRVKTDDFPRQSVYNAVVTRDGGLLRRYVADLEDLLCVELVPLEYDIYAENKKWYNHHPDEQQPATNVSFLFFSIKGRIANTGNARAEFFLERDDTSSVLQFQAESTKDAKLGGGFGVIKKGFSAATTEHDLAVKRFDYKIFGENMFVARIVAMRGAYFSSLLGRRAYAFEYHDKQYIVSDWFAGPNLHHLPIPERQNIPFNVRLKFAIQLGTQLAFLHSLGLIHGDIKPLNIIITPDNAYLIDFDGMFLRGELHTSKVTYSKETTDPELVWKFETSHRHSHQRRLLLNEDTDRRAYGISICTLFPEIFQCKIIRKSETRMYSGVNQLFEHVAYDIQRVSGHPEHDRLASYISSILSVDRNTRPASTSAIVNELNKIATEVYKAEIKIENKFREGVDRTQVEKTLRAIAVEANEFDLRSKIYATRQRQMLFDISAPNTMVEIARFCTFGKAKLLAGLPTAKQISFIDCLERAVKNAKERRKVVDFYTAACLEMQENQRASFALRCVQAMKYERIDLFSHWVGKKIISVTNLCCNEMAIYLGKHTLEERNDLLYPLERSLSTFDEIIALAIFYNDHHFISDIVRLLNACRMIMQTNELHCISVLNAVGEVARLEIFDRHIAAENIRTTTFAQLIHLISFNTDALNRFLTRNAEKIFAVTIRAQLLPLLNENIILDFTAQLPMEWRLLCMIKYADLFEKIPLEIICKRLNLHENVEIFWQTRLAIIQELNSYLAEEVSLHAARIIRLKQRICDAESVEGMRMLLLQYGKGEMLPAANSQTGDLFLAGPPRNLLISFGFRQTIEKCLTIIASAHALLANRQYSNPSANMAPSRISKG